MLLCIVFVGLLWILLSIHLPTHTDLINYIYVYYKFCDMVQYEILRMYINLQIIKSTVFFIVNSKYPINSHQTLVSLANL